MSKPTSPYIAVRHRYSISDGKGEPIAHVEVYENEGAFWVTDLWTHPDHRERGHASNLLDCAVGQWQAFPLYLSVQPYTDRPLSASQLRSFYAMYGFEPTEVPGVLHRRPAPWPPAAVVYPKSNAAPAPSGVMEASR